MTGSRRTMAYASWLGMAVAVIAICWLRGQVYVQPEMFLEGAGRYQIFWDTGGGFSEPASKRVALAGDGLRRITLPALPASTRAIRVDPESALSGFRFCGVSGRNSDGPVWESARVTGVHETRVDAANDGCVRVQVFGGAVDPQVIAQPVQPDSGNVRSAGHLLRAAWLLLAASIAGALLCAPPRIRVRMKDATASAAAWADRRRLVCFLLLGGALGTGYALISPPGSVPDELAHAGKLARVVSGDWYGSDGAGPFLPVRSWYGPFGDYVGSENIYTRQELVQHVGKPLQCIPSAAGAPWQAASGTPVAYAGAAAVLSVVCATGGTFGEFLYSARIANLLIALLLAGIGIHFCHAGRWALFAVALLPMSLYMMASISYDSLILGASIGYLGIVSGVWSGPISCRRAFPWLIMLSVLLVTAKPLTGWLFALPLVALPKCRRERFPAHVWLVGVIVLPMAGHAVWSLYGLGHAAPRSDVGVHGLGGLLSDPAGFLTAVPATFRANAAILAKQVIGTFGWLDVTLAWPWYASATVMLLAAVTTGTPDRTGVVSASSRAYGLAIAALAALATMAVFYAFWTPANGRLIEGLQGRYFTIVVLAMLIFASVRGKVLLRGAYVLAAFPLLVMLNIAGWLSIAERYFVG